MPLFTKESLETLRSRIDLVEVVGAHVDLKRAGAAYKALCPFHEEKTPSFTIQRGDGHYHCFGCGAHGDAIAFLMEHLRLTFFDAVENLAERFHVALQKSDASEQKGPPKGQLKEILQKAARIYHCLLLHTAEGHEALGYLYERGLNLDFVRQFQLGWAPKSSGIVRKLLMSYSDELLKEAGLLFKEGGRREFFSERITFPICDSLGAVIGFSARKIKESTFGGKYINTSETPLFKKSQVLFGLNYSRRRIAKEKRALIVEGQIDALRLIQEGLNFTVASLGTAFGEGHVQTLIHLGVTEVYLAFDGDSAGQQAAVKVGDLFQKEGVEVCILPLPPGEDPDLLLLRRGPSALVQLLDNTTDYLSFLVGFYAREFDLYSPAGKTQLLQTIGDRIRAWKHPLMVHESLRRLAHLIQVPEEMVGLTPLNRGFHHFKRASLAGPAEIDPNFILETDLLRWLLLMGSEFAELTAIARENLTGKHFYVDRCRHLYQVYLEAASKGGPLDLLSIAIGLEDDQAQQLISEILLKRVKKERAREHLIETVQKILDRHWMQEGEEIKRKVQSGRLSDEEALELARELGELKRSPPQVQLPAVKE